MFLGNPIPIALDRFEPRIQFPLHLLDAVRVPVSEIVLLERVVIDVEQQRWMRLRNFSTWLWLAANVINRFGLVVQPSVDLKCCPETTIASRIAGRICFHAPMRAAALQLAMGVLRFHCQNLLG